VQKRHEPRMKLFRDSTILSPLPAFWSPKKIFGFNIHQNLFFEKSQYDKIVYNDTLTICIKNSIWIDIKGFIFVFINFTKSLNCEELLQFCINKDKFYIISQGFHVRIKRYQCQFRKQSRFCEILEFVLLLYALENLKNYLF